jgi:hypothetical protein
LTAQPRIVVLGRRLRVMPGHQAFSIGRADARTQPPSAALVAGSPGVTHTTGHTGAVTLIRRFGSALNLNVHLHMIFVDGVYVTGGVGPPVSRHVPSPGAAKLHALVQRIAECMGRLLEKRGLIERDI